MRDVLLISQQKLKRMLARRQLQPRLCLTPTKVQVVSIVRDLFFQIRQFGVDQQMVMSSVDLVDPRRCYTHALEAHPHPQLSAADDRAIRWPDDVGFRSRRRR